MAMRTVLVSMLMVFFLNPMHAQMFIHTSDLFPQKTDIQGSGELTISQDPAVDTLMSRYILGNKLLNGGMEGFRIQIFRSSTRNAREESNKIKAEFLVDFPEIPSYAEYQNPGYFLIRAGDFRTNLEGAKTLAMVRKKYPYAYMVRCVINFPDLNKK